MQSNLRHNVFSEPTFLLSQFLSIRWVQAVKLDIPSQFTLIYIILPLEKRRKKGAKRWKLTYFINIRLPRFIACLHDAMISALQSYALQGRAQLTISPLSIIYTLYSPWFMKVIVLIHPISQWDFLYFSFIFPT